MIAVEWSEGFALPIAPLVLLVQGASFLLPRWWLRLTIASACCLAVYLMYQHVLNIDLAPEEGANIGAGILALEWRGRCSGLSPRSFARWWRAR